MMPLTANGAKQMPQDQASLAPQGAALQMFFMIFEDKDGNNLDLFVTAPDPSTARMLWLNYYERKENQFGASEIVRILSAPAVAAAKGAHAWSDLAEVKLFVKNGSPVTAFGILAAKADLTPPTWPFPQT